MQIYDLKCSIYGRQLNFRETIDKTGDLIIEVEPCPYCSIDDVRDIEECLEPYGLVE